MNAIARIAADCACVLGLLAGASPAGAQAGSASRSGTAEQGEFRLHMEMNPIGTERYELVAGDSGVNLITTFGFVDRSSPDTTRLKLRAGPDLAVHQFNLTRHAPPAADTRITIERAGDSLVTSDGERITRRPAPERYFTVAGYAPFAVQQELVRYWAAHGRPDTLPLLPNGAATIVAGGNDTVRVAGRDVTLERYTVGGVVWGYETLWFDRRMRLVGAVTNEAGGNHFEVIREGFEDALAQLVGKAVRASMTRLAALIPVAPAPAAIALIGGTLIDGSGADPIPDAVVVIRGRRIVAAGSRRTVTIPGDAARIEVSGKYLLPGLWDMHAHYSQVDWGPAYLGAGVTTVRDVGNEFEFIRAVRTAISSGRGLGPRILVAGFIDGDSPAAIGVRRARTAEEARRLVREYHQSGFEQIKLYNSVPAALIPVICSEAHRLGMTVTGHIPRSVTGFEALADGMDQINHVSFIRRMMAPADTVRPSFARGPVDLDSPEARRTIRVLLERHVVLDPTLAVFEMATHSADQSVASFEPGIAMLPPQLASAIEHSGLPPSEAAAARRTFDGLVAIVGALHRAGVPIVAGTDQQVPGHSLHRELELYVRAGFTPMEALQSATLIPARAMRLERETGTVASGKRADLIVLDRDPLADIANIRSVHLVIAAGRPYDPTLLWHSAGFQPELRVKSER
jgi:imidazolonepropionase-like amidohydrolase